MYLSDRNTTIASLIFNIFCVKSLLKKMLIHMYGHRRGSGCILTTAIVASGKEEVFPARHDRGFAAQFPPQTTAKKSLWHPGYLGACCPGNFLDFNSLKSHFISWDPKSFKQDIGQFHSPRIKPGNLESFFFIKNISIM